MLTLDMNHEKKYYTTAEVAQLLGVSRVAVFKQIQAGKIKAQKTGRNYVIFKADLPTYLSSTLPQSEKKEITTAVKKVVLEYAVTLKKLGEE